MEAKTEVTLCAYEREDKKPCPYPEVPGLGKCIFHLPANEKELEAFEEAFLKEIRRQIHEGSRKLDIEGFVIPAIFMWKNLPPNKFNAINATAVRFEAFADFTEANFGDACSFTGTTFCQSAWFRKATFGDRTTFSATFKKTSYFSYSRFGDDTSFSGSNFYGKASFENAVFGNWPYFGEISFHENVDFRCAEFGKNADFQGTAFLKESVFAEAAFCDVVWFTEVLFSGPVTFRQANLIKANFDQACFGERADFSGANLEGLLITGRTVINSSISFRSANFGASKFRGLNFQKEADFSWSDLSYAEFVDCNFRHVLLANSRGLRTCRLHNIGWGEHDRSPFFRWRSNGAWIVADELKLKEESHLPKKDYGAVERIYRQLKANFEENKNFPDAGHFHYGEMEMRRLAKQGWFKRSVGSLVGWYWILSGYGERWQRALLSAIIVLTASAFIYSAGGFISKVAVPEKGYAEIPTKMQFNIHNDLLYNLRILKNGLIFSFKVAFLRTDGFAQSLSLGTTAGVALETVAGPLTLGLLGLAVGRQLKRN